MNDIEWLSVPNLYNRVVDGLGLVVPIPRVVQQPVFFTIADTVMSESKPSAGGLSQGAARHLRMVHAR